MRDPKPWSGDRIRIGVEGSLHRQILGLCERLGLVLIDVRDVADPLAGHTLVFHDVDHVTEVTIEGKLLQEEPEPEPEGWGIPGNTKKYHFFVSRTSLCRKWGFYSGRVEPDNGPSPDDCAACRKKFDARAKS